VRKMITIGSVGSAPHIHVYLFFILPEPYSPNGNSRLDHNAAIDADFLKLVPFGGVEIGKKILLEVVFTPKN
jgi:hypothetical protein